MSISIRVPAPHPADNIHILGIRIHIPGMFIHIPGICIHFPPEALFTSLRNLYTHPPEYANGAHRGRRYKEPEERRKAFAARSSILSLECDRNIRAESCKGEILTRSQGWPGRPQPQQRTRLVYLFSVE